MKESDTFQRRFYARYDYYYKLHTSLVKMNRDGVYEGGEKKVYIQSLSRFGLFL